MRSRTKSITVNAASSPDAIQRLGSFSWNNCHSIGSPTAGMMKYALRLSRLGEGRADDWGDMVWE